ncbi:MAG TPA: TIGR03032 family protein [Limnobacter sp.]|nr:TIGR03032 family protein [Limnobacter sp.]
MIQTNEVQPGPSAHTQVYCNPEWLELQKNLGFSLLLGTRSMGDLHVISVPPDGSLVNFQVVKFPLCMGIALWQNHLAVACQTDVRLYHDLLALPGIESVKYQRCYAPRSLYFTGNLDAHELAFDAQGKVHLVSAKYSCVVTLSASHSARMVWHPSFISGFTPEDRCHLNGLCMENGALRYVTFFAQSDDPAGWRKQPFNAGAVWCAQTQELVCGGLVQPHSPRIHNGELYVLNSGAGELGRIDRSSGRYDCIAFVGGYARGLSFVGEYAVFGISKPRRESRIPGFPLHERLGALGQSDRCQLTAVHLPTGNVMQAIVFEGAAREFFDCAVIPNCTQAAVMSMEEAQHPALLSLDASSAALNKAEACVC